MASVKLTKNELKVQKDALKMYQRYLPTLALKKQQLQTEIYAIRSKAASVREQREELETLATKWNRGSIPMHLKKKYAVLSFRVRLFLHCTGSTSVPVNRS